MSKAFFLEQIISLLVGTAVVPWLRQCCESRILFKSCLPVNLLGLQSYVCLPDSKSDQIQLDLLLRKCAYDCAVGELRQVCFLLPQLSGCSMGVVILNYRIVVRILRSIQ